MVDKHSFAKVVVGQRKRGGSFAYHDASVLRA